MSVTPHIPGLPLVSPRAILTYPSSPQLGPQEFLQIHCMCVANSAQMPELVVSQVGGGGGRPQTMHPACVSCLYWAKLHGGQAGAKVTTHISIALLS